MTVFLEAILLGVVATSVAYFWVTAEWRRRDRFSKRSAPEFSDWYRQFYGGMESELPDQKVKAIINVIAQSIGIQMTQLRPTDRLDVELSIHEAIPLDDSIDMFEESLSQTFGKSITICQKWHTLDDVIRGIAPNIPQT